MALRSDAQLNQDRLLAAATAAFARDGADTSLKAIAHAAGVGIGTLYRRFPTRESLVWAIYVNEVDRVCASVPRLLQGGPALEALGSWMHAFLDLLATKRGMADALKAALAADDEARLATRASLTAALGTLLGAGVEQGTVRAGVEPLDVMMALGGIALIAGEPEQQEQAGRLVDLLLRGVAAPSQSRASRPSG
ncbi:TetR/AcrR family transcriptional regulator [Jatrophihabitans sp.]|uniref:TetR/AcrR family transcriptional regulator n=1 Tax=Jatrophihabitans sp. TaxID=1932789 RepID=UPI0030C6D62B|nr:TetR family transcriptional regulator [Jatrophihabitans sp.]